MPEPETIPGMALTPGPIEAATTLDLADHAALETAIRRLMNSRGVVVRVADLLGGMFGRAAALGWRGMKVPDGITRQLKGIAETALRRAFEVAIVGRDRTAWATTQRGASMLAISTGAIGGFVGIAGFLPDATATTLLIMRNIAEIAVEEGENLDRDDARQACLEVFALGSPGFGEVGEEGDTGYWSARLIMHGRPMSLLLGEVAATYGLRLSEKLVSQAVPLVGAASGALVNAAFLAHYRNVARVHFTIRRLERHHGQANIRQEAEDIAESLRIAKRQPPLRRTTAPIVA